MKTTKQKTTKPTTTSVIKGKIFRKYRLDAKWPVVTLSEAGKVMRLDSSLNTL